MGRGSRWGYRSLSILIAVVLIVGAMAFFWVSPAEATGDGYSPEELAFISTLNHHRMANGLQPLQLSDTISEAAYRHSHDMAHYDFFSHLTGWDDNGPLPGVRSDWFATSTTPWERMDISGYPEENGSGEIIAAGMPFVSPTVVFEAFRNSPGHNSSMLYGGSKVAGASRYYAAAAPYGYYWTVDFGAVIQGPTHSFNFYEQEFSSIEYAGNWANASHSVFSGGSLDYINSPGAVTVNFTGTSLAWVGTKAAHYGKATVTLDGGAPVTVDCYSPTTLYQAGLYSTGILAEGDHILTIEWAGDKNPSSSYYYITIDAFDVMGSLSPPS